MRSRGAKPPQGAWRAVGRNDGAVTADGEHGRTREMLAGSVRFVPRPVTKGGAGALFLITWHAPRRFPDLARFTASAGFALLHDPAAGWTGSQFGLIESGAPWLDLAGRRLDDYCRVSDNKSLNCLPTCSGTRIRSGSVGFLWADGPETLAGRPSRPSGHMPGPQVPGIAGFQAQCRRSRRARLRRPR